MYIHVPHLEIWKSGLGGNLEDICSKAITYIYIFLDFCCDVMNCEKTQGSLTSLQR